MNFAYCIVLSLKLVRISSKLVVFFCMIWLCIREAELKIEAWINLGSSKTEAQSRKLAVRL